ncbi:two component transcriptional regulator, LuxR family [Dyadobacter sp. SG02]|uniref:LuxR C-terminal-related transcriptional regulator n=1 Tax=Dyadobacter sp. SG02 TaxID=1855291 RepID=UPI0008CEEA3B|nr:response regulator transcription factor [Dyadobacter sp. SG02]SEJ37909.1 two component transcriptional regulator, LuxR family [Dyadobacter sp. SG02]
MNILIIDDQTLLRTGMRLLLQSLSDEYCLFEAANLETAQSILNSKTNIELIISEIKIKGVITPNLVDILRSVKPDVSILFYSGLAERLYALPVMRSGADGFIMKHSKPHELARAITIITSGGKYISVELQSSLLPKIDAGHHMDELESISRLSKRERAIMTQVTEGKSTKEIAFSLNLKCNTVSTYKKRIYKKMNVTDNFELFHKSLAL